MKKNSEKAPVKEQIAQGELELEQILKEIEEDPRLRDAHVPDNVGEKLFAQIAELEAAIQDVPEEDTVEEDISTEDISTEDISTENISMKNIKEDSMSILEERYPNMANMSQEEKNIFLAGLEVMNVVKFKTHRRRSKKKKVYFMVAAIVILTLAMGTVGMGERYKWLQIGTKEMENVAGISVDSEEKYIKDIVDDEISAYQSVRNMLGVPVVKLNVVDAGIQFKQIQIWEDDVKAELLYEYNDNILCYGIVANQNKVSGVDLPTDDLVEEKVIQNGEVEICIRRYIVEGESEILRANFIYHNIQYGVFGMIKMEKMEELLNNLVFFEN